MTDHADAVAAALAHIRSESRTYQPWKLAVNERQFVEYQQRFGIPADSMTIVALPEEP